MDSSKVVAARAGRFSNAHAACTGRTMVAHIQSRRVRAEDLRLAD